MKAAAKLRLVEDARPNEPPKPEDLLPALFEQEARLLKELGDARRRIYVARQAYAKNHGLLVLPTCERLKQMFGRR